VSRRLGGWGIGGGQVGCVWGKPRKKTGRCAWRGPIPGTGGNGGVEESNSPGDRPGQWIKKGAFGANGPHPPHQPPDSQSRRPWRWGGSRRGGFKKKEAFGEGGEGEKKRGIRGRGQRGTREGGDGPGQTIM